MNETLGELEYAVMFALVARGVGADGRALRDEVERRTGRTVSPGACYTVLERLEAKGMIRSRLGDTTPARGGRQSREYSLRKAGALTLLQAHERLSAVADGLLPKLSLYADKAGS